MLAGVLVSLLVSSAPSGVKPESAVTRAHAGAHAQDELGRPLAPDGQRGFGHGRTTREIEKLVRTPTHDERAFLEGCAT
jgi:hypothetical protein